MHLLPISAVRTRLVAGFAALMIGSSAGAAPLPRGEKPVTYAVVDQDLRDVITEVAQQSGLRVSVSEAVHGRVRGRLPPAPLSDFLDHLAATYGLDWYYDGSALFVTTAAEATSKLLSLGLLSLPQLDANLDALGVADARWPLRGSADGRLVVVNGPPRYVQLVEQTLTALSQQRGQSVDKVGVFRGTVEK